jgi:glycosyltransferase involved in cell wall biosynthesis
VTNPSVSICIPAFRAKAYIWSALESIKSQVFTDWELIVTEDGSDDGTKELVETFKTVVSQPVHWERNEKNRGLPATRNSGIAAAKGEYIALLDADDYWAAEHLEILRRTLAATAADIAHSGAVLFESKSGETLEVRAPNSDVVRNFPRSLYDREYVIQPSSVMVTRRLLKRVGGFNESFRYVEDREMWIRCARAGAKFSFSGENTCFYRRHSAALSTHAAEMAIAGARVFQMHVNWFEIPDSIRIRGTTSAWIAAARIVQRVEPRRAAGLLRRAIVIAPRIRYLIWSCALNLFNVLKGR